MNELEAKVKMAINDLCDELWPGHWSFMPVQTGFGKTGVPDHLKCVPVTITPEMVGKTYGMFLGIEAKRSKKKPNPNQYRELMGITAAGGFAQYTAGLEGVEGLYLQLLNKFGLHQNKD